MKTSAATTTNRVCGPKFENVKLYDLMVDAGYQRVESNSKSRHQQMARNWDWDLFGAPVVARRRNGDCAVVDGQNRISALLIAFPDKNLTIKCQIIQARTPAEEALFFCGKNGAIVRVSANHRFKARHFASQQPEKAIIKILDKKGIKVAYGRGRPSHNTTKNPAVFRAAFDKLGAHAFNNLIECLWSFRRPEFDDVIEPNALTADFVGGMLLFVLGTDQPIEDVLTALPLGSSAAEIIDRAKRNNTSWSREGRRNAIRDEIELSLKRGMRKL